MLMHTFLFENAQLDVFFFSSRRRHTRWPRDWSSDVCSSDLRMAISRRPCQQLKSSRRPAKRLSFPANKTEKRFWERSEERRVGKECRSRVWAEEGKKKRRERLDVTQNELASRRDEKGQVQEV